MTLVSIIILCTVVRSEVFMAVKIQTWSTRRRGLSPAANREQERVMILPVGGGGEWCGVPHRPLQVQKGRQGVQSLLTWSRLEWW
jgi:hypothetical protein